MARREDAYKSIRIDKRTGQSFRIVIWRNPLGERKTHRCGPLGSPAAEEEADRFIAEHASNRQAGNGIETFARHCVKRIVAMKANVGAGEGQVRAHTYVTYKAVVLNNIVGSELGKLRLLDICPSDIESWTLAQRRVLGGKKIPLKRNTMALRVWVVSSMLAVAVGDGLLRFNPAYLVMMRLKKKGIRKEVAPPKGMNFVQLGSFLEAAREVPPCNPPLHIYAAVAGDLGVRVGEAFGLKWTDIEGKEVIVCRQFSLVEGDGDGEAPKDYVKGEAPLKSKLIPMRKVAMPASLIALLADWRRQQSETALRTGTPRSEYVLGIEPEEFDAACSRLQHSMTLAQAIMTEHVDFRITTHTFRHTRAIGHMASGGDLRKLQHLLGHSDMRTTMVYLNVAPEADPTGADAWEAHKEAARWKGKGQDGKREA